MNNPKISVVVPCYNMIFYIKETLDSIMNQKYDNLELIIVDGASNDGTLDIVNEYKQDNVIIISEPDNGQYDAIAKGFSRSTGEILCWLNADDIYFPWTLKTISKIFNENHQINWIKGIPAYLDQYGQLTNIYNNISGAPQKFIKNGWFRKNLFGYLQQESMFWRRCLWEKTKGLSLNYKLAADFELWTKFAEFNELVSVGLPLAAFRKRPQSRSVLNMIAYESEVDQIIAKKKIIFAPLKAFAGYSNTTNFFVRLLTWRKTPIYYFNVKKDKWLFEYRKRPVSNLSLTQLILEK